MLTTMKTAKIVMAMAVCMTVSIVASAGNNGFYGFYGNKAGTVKSWPKLKGHHNHKKKYDPHHDGKHYSNHTTEYANI